MARAVSTRRKAAFTVIGWLVGLMIFFPVLWTVLTSFKSELDAIAIPPKYLFFDWTLENYREVNQRSNYFRFMMNSVYLSLGSTFIGLLFAVPASPLAQPWSIVGGNGVSALVGVAAAMLIPNPFVAASVAICVAIAADASSSGR